MALVLMAVLLIISAVAGAPIEDQANAGMSPNLAPLLKDPMMGIRIEAAQRLTGVPSEMLTEPQTDAFKSTMAEYRSSLEFTADMPSDRYNRGILEQSLNQLGGAEL